jgi:hypothetical protein
MKVHFSRFPGFVDDGKKRSFSIRALPLPDRSRLI